jgi:hypothetical protein
MIHGYLCYIKVRFTGPLSRRAFCGRLEWQGYGLLLINQLKYHAKMIFHVVSFPN